MSFRIQINGLTEIKQMLGQNFAPAIKAAMKPIATQVHDKLSPYPPETIANNPANPRGRWYERGYGPHWWVGKGSSELLGAGKSQRRKMLKLRREAAVIHSKKTSERLKQSWHIEPTSSGWRLHNSASYSGYLHSADDQAGWNKRRGWITDKQAIGGVIASGFISRTIAAKMVSQLKRTGFRIK